MVFKFKIGSWVKESKFDYSVFYLYDNYDFKCFVSSHVDDFCWNGTGRFYLKINDTIKQAFQIS